MLCRVEDVWQLSGSARLVAAWILALVLALAIWSVGRFLRGHRNGWKAAGLGVMSVSAWLVVLQMLPNLVKTFCAEGNVASILPGAPGPQPPADLSRQYIDALLLLGYVAVGGLVWLQGARPGWWRHPTMRGMAQGLAGLLPLGRSEGASLKTGLAIFPLLAAGAFTLRWITGQGGVYFDQMTTYHAVIISVAAAVSEEILYRGFMQQSLRFLLQGGRQRNLLAATTASAAAIILQAIPFTYTHADYGDPSLLLFAFSFAILAGLATQLFGIWCAIALHFLIDFYNFASMPTADPALFAMAVFLAVPVLAVAAMQYRTWWFSWRAGRAA